MATIGGTSTSLDFPISSSFDPKGIDEAMAGLEALKSQIDDMSNEHIRLQADATAVEAKIAEVKSQINDLSGTADMQLRTGGAMAELEALKAELAGLEDKAITIRGDDSALVAKIAEAKASLDTLHDKTVTIRGESDMSPVRADMARTYEDARVAFNGIDKTVSASMSDANANFRRAVSDMGAASSALSTASKAAFGSMAQNIALLAIGLAPVALSAVGMLGAITSGFLSAGVATVAYGASLFTMFKASANMITTNTSLNDTLSKQEAKLSTLTPGSAAYNTQLKAIGVTQAEINANLTSGTPIQNQLTAALLKASAAWKEVGLATESAVGGPVVALIDAFAGKIHLLAPLINDVANALKPMFDSIIRWINGIGPGMSSFQGYIQWVDANAIPIISVLGKVFGDIMKIIGQIAVAFGPLAHTLVLNIKEITDHLAAWGSAGGFQRFAEYVTKNLPAVTTLLQNLQIMIGHIVQALMGMTSFTLSGLVLMSRVLLSMPIGVLQALIYGFEAFKAMQYVIVFWRALDLGIAAVKVALAAATVAQIAFSSAMATGNLITDEGALAGMASAIGMVAKSFKEAAIWGQIAAVATKAWAIAQGILDAVTLTFDILLDAMGIGELLMLIGLIIAAIIALIIGIRELIKHWRGVWTGMKDAAEAVWDLMVMIWKAVVKVFQVVWDVIGPPLKAAWDAVWGWMKSTGMAIWDWMKSTWPIVANWFKSVWDTVSGALKGAWDAAWGWMKSTGVAIWDWMKSTWSATVSWFKSTWDTVSGALKSAWDVAWRALKAVVEPIWSGLKTGWDATVGFFKSVFDKTVGALKSAWSATWDGIKSVTDQIWGGIKQGWDLLTGALKSAWDQVSGALKSAWGSVWGSIKSAALSIWDTLKSSWDTLGRSFSGIGKTISQVWSSDLKPALDAIGHAFGGLGKIVKDLWNNDIKPAWDAIWHAIESLWGGGKSGPAKSVTGATGGVHTLGKTAHENSGFIKTAFNIIADVIKIAIDIVVVVIKVATVVIRVFADVITFLVKFVVVPLFKIFAESIKIAMVVVKVIVEAVAIGFKIFAETIRIAMAVVKVIIEGVAAAIRIFGDVVKLTIQVVTGIIIALSNTWQVMKTAALAVWDAMKAAWTTFVNALKTAWDSVSSALSAAWNTVWNAMKTAVQAVWDALKTAWDSFINGLKSIWDTVSSALSSAWNTVWNAMKTAVQAVWDALKTAWDSFINGLKSIWDTVSSALSSAWNTVWNALKTAAQAVWDALKAAWDTVLNAVKTAWDTISATLQAAWNTAWNAMKTAAEAVWNAISAFFTTIWTTIENTFNTVVGAIERAVLAVWNTMKGDASTVWNAVSGFFISIWGTITTTFTSIVNNIRKVILGVWNTMKSDASTVWTDIKNGVTTAWKDVANAFVTPINFVIRTVYTDGIEKVWNSVVGAIGLSSIKLPDFGGIPNFAEGGHVTGPGGPRDDRIPAMLSNGEFVIQASAVDTYGKEFLHALNSQKLANGGPVAYFAGGGDTGAGQVAANVGGTAASAQAANTANTSANASNTAAPGFVSQVTTPVATLIGKILSGGASAVIHGIVDPLVGAMPGPAGVKALLKGMIDGMVNKIISFVEAGIKKLLAAGTGGGTVPTGARLTIETAALAAAGVPPPGVLADWLTGLNTLITRESAWNASAINTTDSNAAAGIPSQGLAQVIPPTFAAYHVAGTANNILDPVANVAAAIRYIVATYGNITNVQQANASLPPKGYDMGGPLLPGLTYVNNSTGTVEGILNPTGMRSIGGLTGLGRLNSGGHSGNSEPPVYVNVENNWYGNPSPEAVDNATTGMADKLRVALTAGTGKRAS